jgi:hypothetical protein
MLAEHIVHIFVHDKCSSNTVLLHVSRHDSQQQDIRSNLTDTLFLDMLVAPGRRQSVPLAITRRGRKFFVDSNLGMTCFSDCRTRRRGTRKQLDRTYFLRTSDAGPATSAFPCAVQPHSHTVDCAITRMLEGRHADCHGVTRFSSVLATGARGDLI